MVGLHLIHSVNRSDSSAGQRTEISVARMQWQGWSVCANVETETRQRQDFRDRAKARQAEKHHYITLSGRAGLSLSFERRIYAVVCWFHSSGLELVFNCWQHAGLSQFLVQGLERAARGDISTVTDDFCQHLKTWLFIQSYTLTSSELLSLWPPINSV